MRTNRRLTLLEVVVGLSLLLLAAGSLGWKMQNYLEKRRFRTSAEQMKSRMMTIQRLAVNQQSDWRGELTHEGKNWVFRVECLDPPRAKSSSPIYLRGAEVMLNGKKEEAVTFGFFSSGFVQPSGVLEIRSVKDGEIERWELPRIFGQEEGDGSRALGPIHPEET